MQDLKNMLNKLGLHIHPNQYFPSWIVPSLFYFGTIAFCNLVLKANKQTNVPSLELCQEKKVHIFSTFCSKREKSEENMQILHIN